MLVIASPAFRWTHHMGYWVSSAAAITLSYASNSELFLIIASLFALGMLMVSTVDGLRGSYTVTIDGSKDLVSVVATAAWRKKTECQFALSSFGTVATRWDDNHGSYRLELIEKNGCSALLVKRFAPKRRAFANEDTSAAYRSHVAAITGLADAGVVHHQFQPMCQMRQMT